MISGALFGKVYGSSGMKVLDVGGKDINGSLRKPFTEMLKIQYTSLDIEEHPSVDVVMKPGDSLPFPDESFDLIVSTSCFEHDPCFWLTFREMCRIIKMGGFIYMNAPSNGYYHGYPGDNWRFYSDAGQALAYWSGKTIDGKSYPVKVEETFHLLPKSDIWVDFVCVWKRVEEKDDNIKVSNEIRMKNGPLRKALVDCGFPSHEIVYNGGHSLGY
jgi:SAM-dependent methyltransferase